MALTWLPHAPFHWLALAFALLVAAAWLARAVRSRLREVASKPVWRIVATLFSAAALVFSVLALWGPARVLESNPLPPRLFVVLDVSASVQRVEGGWPALHALTAAKVDDWIDAMPSIQVDEARATVLSFRNTAAMARKDVPLERLPGVMRSLSRDVLAGGDGSDVAAGLRRVADLTREGTARDAVLLVSDGFETSGDAAAQAQVLAARGIPVHVLPVGGAVPALSIAAADVPRHVLSGSGTFLRGVMRHGGSGSGEGVLAWERPGSEETQAQSFELPQGGWGRFRWPVTLEGLGIDFTAVRMYDAEGNLRHQRRLFTHLKRPPRILAVGGDFRWVPAMEGSGIEVIERSPEQLNRLELNQVDALVINDVAGPQLDPLWIRSVVSRVQQGMGLFVVNGDHVGLEELDETVYMSLAQSPLGEMLPLEPGPRAFKPKGSKRQIVVLVDASGSMSGARLAKAKEIISYVINTHLGPNDTLDLMAFSGGALHMVKTRAMDEAGRAYAIEQLEKLKAGGGTDPRDALNLLRDRRFTDCGMLFLSDGEFGTISIRPECRATVFAIGKSSVPYNSPLYDLADPFPVPPDFDPRNVRLPYFEPEGRNKYFETGNFRPLRILVPETAGWNVPQIPTEGAAITHIKEDTVLVAVRPKLTDPILAYRDIGATKSMAFTGALADGWVETAEGRAAIQDWVGRLISYKARDRYDFQMTDFGSYVELGLSLHDAEGGMPNLDALRLRLEIAGRPPQELVPYFEDVVRGEWRMRMQLPDGGIEAGQLVISEYGEDALNEPQAVPVRLPPALTDQRVGDDEPFHWGINEPLLRSLSDATGGQYNPADSAALFPPPTLEARIDPLWQWFALAAMICYVAAIAASRFDG